MDCPHCNSENLLGATTCGSCGKLMVTRNRFGPAVSPTTSAQAASAAAPQTNATPAARRNIARELARGAAPPGDAAANVWGGGAADAAARAPTPKVEHAAPEQAMCRICRGLCDIGPGQTAAQAVCGGCKTLVEANSGANLGENDVLVYPASSEEAEAEFASKLGTGDVRPRILGARRAGLRMGPVAVVAAIVVTLIGLAVVKVMDRKEDRAARLLGDVRPASVSLVLSPEQDRVVKWDTTLKIRAVREEARASYGPPQVELDMNQTSLQTSEMSVVREDAEGVVLDVSAECRVTEQTGRIGGNDAREAEVYPFGGLRKQSRVRAVPGRPTAVLGDGDALPGRDTPPFFTIGDVGLAAHTLNVGHRWSAPLRLTILAERGGRLFTVPFAAEFAYAGRATRQGIACAAFRMNATLPQDVPPPLDESMNRKAGELAGALFFEITTGLVVDAVIDIDCRFWRDRGRIEDDLRVTGRYEVHRR